MSADEKSHLCRYIIWEAMYRRVAEIDEIEDNAAEVEKLLFIVKQCENIEEGEEPSPRLSKLFCPAVGLLGTLRPENVRLGLRRCSNGSYQYLRHYGSPEAQVEISTLRRPWWRTVATAIEIQRLRDGFIGQHAEDNNEPMVAEDTQ